MKQILIFNFYFLSLLYSDGYNFAPKITIPKEEKRFVIAIPSYKNEKFYKKNLDSVFGQKYSNFRVIYVDDASPDNTWRLVNEYVEERGLSDKITLIRNSENKGAMYNHYTIAHLCEDEEIYISLDGDDWWAHPGVLQRINQAFADPKVWMVYGNAVHYPSGETGFDRRLLIDDLKEGKHRSLPFSFGPPRCFYAALFKAIPKSMFLDGEGNFFSSACDVAFMFAMADMARDHIFYIDEALYVYNIDTGINDYSIREKEQLEYEQQIREKTPLEKIEDWRNLI